MNDLCIGGGGMNGTCFIGCLEYLDKNKLLDLRNFYGTSIGSLIGVAYLLNIKPINMLNYILKLNLEEIVKYDILNIQNFHFIDDKLLDSLINILNIDENVNNLTLKELSDRTSVNVNIYATDISLNKYVSFNNKDTPDLKVITAIKASMSIPFLFRPVEIDNKLYVDGCCKNSYGIPPDDIYICGYTIILTDETDNYTNNIFNSIIYNSIPRTTFLIKCKRIVPLSDYININKIKSNIIIKMYKYGIDMARKYCN